MYSKYLKFKLDSGRRCYLQQLRAAGKPSIIPTAFRHDVVRFRSLERIYKLPNDDKQLPNWVRLTSSPQLSW